MVGTVPNLGKTGESQINNFKIKCVAHFRRSTPVLKENWGRFLTPVEPAISFGVKNWGKNRGHI